MTLQNDFEQRVQELERQRIQLIADFFESRELGSWVSLEQFTALTPSQRIDLREVQEYMIGNDFKKHFWALKKDARLVGFFIISAGAMRSFNSIPNRRA